MGFRVFTLNWVFLNITILNFETRVLMFSNGLFLNHCPTLSSWCGLYVWLAEAQCRRSIGLSSEGP